MGFTKKQAEIRRRFQSKIEKGAKCWTWTGAIGSSGYGQLLVDGKPRTASRVAWELEHGPIPEGLCVLHRCDVRACIRPSHLFLGTNAANVADRVKKGRSASARGARNANVKVTPEMGAAILARYAVVRSARKVGAEFGISELPVRRLIHGQHWSQS